MVFENGVKNIQAAAYNGARTVNESDRKKAQGHEVKEYLNQKKINPILFVCTANKYLPIFCTYLIKFPLETRAPIEKRDLYIFNATSDSRIYLFNGNEI